MLHGESSKRLATPRNTKDKKHKAYLVQPYRVICGHQFTTTGVPVSLGAPNSAACVGLTWLRLEHRAEAEGHILVVCPFRTPAGLLLIRLTLLLRVPHPDGHCAERDAPCTSNVASTSVKLDHPQALLL